MLANNININKHAAKCCMTLFMLATLLALQCSAVATLVVFVCFLALWLFLRALKLNEFN